MAIGGSFDKLDVLGAVVTVVAAVSAATCAQFVKLSDGGVSLWWMSGQIGSVAIAALTPAASAVRAKRAERRAATDEATARTRARLEMNEALDPIVRALGANDGRDPVRLQNEVVSLVVKTAAHIIGPDQGVRSCYFELQHGPPKQLVATRHHAGRTGSNRSTFVEGTPDGDAAIGMVEGNEHRLCEDTAASPPPGWGSKTRDYSTFISVAVTGGGVAFGMLTVDAADPGDLTRRDVDVLSVMAGLIAVAMRSNGTDDVLGAS